MYINSIFYFQSTFIFRSGLPVGPRDAGIDPEKSNVKTFFRHHQSQSSYTWTFFGSDIVLIWYIVIGVQFCGQLCGQEQLDLQFIQTKVRNHYTLMSNSNNNLSLNCV